MISSTAARFSVSSRRARGNCSASSRKVACICRLRPVMMLSSTDMPLNSAMFWKVRAMPSLAACVGVMSARRSPRKVMVPSCGT